ncbi:MAG TPA: 30S ribosomal protein S20 [Pirellulales bacterium]|jgi:small subunit ribosomal protein S20|nr:30S ribosomal protein S20 [Pirellulales bacterium]
MPNTKSAKKRHKQSLVRRERNRAVKSSLKTQIRKTVEKIAAGKLPEAEAELTSATAKLDKAAAAKIIHPNRAARLKSRLSHRIKVAKTASAAPAAQ